MQTAACSSHWLKALVEATIIVPPGDDTGGSLAAILLGISLGGCDAGPIPRVLVQGKVFYKETPLVTGVIVFTPDASHGWRRCYSAFFLAFGFKELT